MAARTKPAEERRADLLAAARKLFVSKGLAATTIEDITSAAGVSLGLFYHYFRSKQDVIFALQEQFSVDFADRLTGAATGTHDWAAKLDALIDAAFRGYRDKHDEHEALFHHGSHNLDQPAHTHLTNAIQQLLEEGVEAGVYRVDDPRATAALLYGALHALDSGFYGRNAPMDRELIAAARQLFRRATGMY